MCELIQSKTQAAGALQVSSDQVELIKRTVAKGATDDELQMFLHLSQKYNLDPFAKEIWFIKYDSKSPTIMTSRDGYLKIAQGNADYDGLISFAVCKGDNFEIDATNYTITHKFGAERGEIIGAWAKCDRKGCKPQVAFVPFDEYNQGNSIWKKYKSAMIQKVAEAFVLKRQFGISGLTTKEEMPEEYDMKNVSDQHLASATITHTESDIPQIPQQVGDYTIAVKGTKTKLSEMSMKQLEWLKKSSKNETTRAMASAYIDEINHKGNEIEGEAVLHDVVTADVEEQTTVTVNADPAALFGGAAI